MKFNIKKFLSNKKKLRAIAWFLIKLNILAIPLYLAILLGVSYEPLQTALANWASEVLKFLGYNIAQSGPLLATIINNQMIQIEVSWDSTGWKSLYALAALSLATPVEFRKKIKFLAFGVPTIFILNFLRIVTTILISFKFGLQYFEIIHTVLWSEGMILAVVLIWYFWLRKVL